MSDTIDSRAFNVAKLYKDAKSHSSYRCIAMEYAPH
jgi:hypothetical protein